MWRVPLPKHSLILRQSRWRTHVKSVSAAEVGEMCFSWTRLQEIGSDKISNGVIKCHGHSVLPIGTMGRREMWYCLYLAPTGLRDGPARWGGGGFKWIVPAQIIPSLVAFYPMYLRDEKCQYWRLKFSGGCENIKLIKSFPPIKNAVLWDVTQCGSC
jgi:hypothetical protein